MTRDAYDAVIIGSGLGGLTAAALLAKSGRRVCVLERNRSLGGAASCYRVGRLTIEASLHETADPRDPREPKHAILSRLGLLDQIEWLPIAHFQTVAGGAVGAPLQLPHGFEHAAGVLKQRFPSHSGGIDRLLSRMARLHETLAAVGEAGETRSLRKLASSAPGLVPLLADWSLPLDRALARDLGDCEGAKCAIAGNLPYYHDDPRRTWWLYFAVAQGGYLGSGGVYVQGGSTRLSRALAKSIKQSGGEVLLGRRAAKIDIGADGRPRAVHHADKDGNAPARLETRLVLAGCAPAALGDMLEQPWRDRLLSAYAAREPSISLFSAHFGLDVAPQGLGLTAYSTVLLPDWMRRLDDYAEAGALLGGRPRGRMPPLTIVNYGAIDSRLDEGGPTLVSVVGVDRMGNWSGLERAAEKERRDAWLAAILEEMERRYPGFATAAKEQILITARSVRDYIGTPGGEVYGFAPLPPPRSFLHGLPTSPRTPLAGLLLASSYAGSGGFTGAMMAGARAASLADSELACG